MKKAPCSISTCARNVARQIRLTATRGRLIALFVAAAKAAAITVTAASSASSIKNLLHGSPFDTNLSDNTSGRNELTPAPRANAAGLGLAAGADEGAAGIGFPYACGTLGLFYERGCQEKTYP